jgi:hypothetical protein
MMDGWEFAAPNIADVFLYYCHRHFNTSPFSGGAMKIAAQRARLRPHELQFLDTKAAGFTKGRRTNTTYRSAWGCTSLPDVACLFYLFFLQI